MCFSQVKKSLILSKGRSSPVPFIRSSQWPASNLIMQPAVKKGVRTASSGKDGMDQFQFQ